MFLGSEKGIKQYRSVTGLQKKGDCVALQLQPQTEEGLATAGEQDVGVLGSLWGRLVTKASLLPPPPPGRFFSRAP